MDSVGLDIAGLIVSLLPLVVVFLGIVWLKKSGALMVLVGLALTALIAWGYFKTDPVIIYAGTVVGIIKSFGITIAVIFAMFLVFLMQVTGALNRISDAIHKVAGTKEEKALFVGMGFGSFVTALGLVAPTLFPPLLVAMGFTPLAAIAIACLGYDPLCSFALLSLPITQPAAVVSSMNLTGVGTFAADTFAKNIVIFLPVVSVGFAFAILWVVGGLGAIKRSWLPALMSGLVISLSALIMVYWNLVPLSIVGVVAGGLSMVSLYIYNTVTSATNREAGATSSGAILKALGLTAVIVVLLAAFSAIYGLKFTVSLDTPGLAIVIVVALLVVLGVILGFNVYKRQVSAKQAKMSADGGTAQSSISLLSSLSPWVILIVLVSIVGLPGIATYLNGLPGQLEVITIPGFNYPGQSIDLNFLTQAYTWILIASIIGIFTLGAKREHVTKALDMSVKRVLGPLLTYSLFFSIAYLMYFSGGIIAGGKFTPGPIANPAMNMDMIIGSALAAIFGTYYGLVAPLPGFIGAVVGGSETSSNVMFGKIQHVAVSNTIGAEHFGLAYGSLAVAGGISSAITPAKITNACATLGEGGKMESKAISVNAWVAIALTAITCVMTFLFLKIGLGF
jgi:lactate permease